MGKMNIVGSGIISAGERAAATVDLSTLRVALVHRLGKRRDGCDTWRGEGIRLMASGAQDGLTGRGGGCQAGARIAGLHAGSRNRIGPDVVVHHQDVFLPVPLRIGVVGPAVGGLRDGIVAGRSVAELAGDAERYARILDGLRAEGTATVLILWSVAEDIRTLAKVSRAMQQSGNLAGALRDARVWGVRQKQVERAVRRFTPAFAERALRQAALIDKLIKGLRHGDVWDELLQLGMRCARVGSK